MQPSADSFHGTCHSLARSITAKPILVVGFCAAWCNTCGDFSARFDRIAATRDDATFVWLDIEDHADVTGEIDIENFPTIAVYHRRRLIHFGTTLPQSPIVLRLLDSLGAQSTTVAADVGLDQLPQRLCDMPVDQTGRVLRGR